MSITRWEGGNPAQWGAGMVGKFTTDQLATRADWVAHGDREVIGRPLHSIRYAPNGSSSVTEVNQLDPGELAWLEPPGDFGRLAPAGRVR